MNIHLMMTLPLMWLQLWAGFFGSQPARQRSATILEFDRTHWRKKCL